MKNKTKTGALPNSAGFPGTDMVGTRMDVWVSKLIKQIDWDYLNKAIDEQNRRFLAAYNQVPDKSFVENIHKRYGKKRGKLAKFNK